MTDSSRPPQDVLRTLLALTQRLTEDPPLEEALQQVTDAALEMLPGQHSSIRLLDESHRELLCGARSGVGLSHRPVVFQPGEGIAGWVVEHGEVVLLGDAPEDARFARKTGQGFTIRSILAVPLWSAAKVMGVLATSSAHPDAFDRDGTLLMRLLANCVAPSIGKARLKRLAITDHQTKAFNRRVLIPRLTQAIEEVGETRRDLSLLLMDLDHFKRVNDNHGHATGDRVLRFFADLVRATVRQSDVLVRRGGEEFVLIMPGAPTHIAQGVAERIRSTLATRVLTLESGGRLTQTVSIGVATWVGGESPQQLEHRADLAMYAAKRAGRDRVELSDPAAEDAPLV